MSSRIALGRENFLFVGTDEAEEDLASLYSIIATREVNGVNPVAYLADVLLRVQTHPASRAKELLPTQLDPAGTPEHILNVMHLATLRRGARTLHAAWDWRV